MGRKVDVEHLVGTAEIAQRLGVKRPQVVHDWMRRYEDFPEPVAQLSNVRVWSWPDIETWARETGRLSWLSTAAWVVVLHESAGGASPHLTTPNAGLGGQAFGANLAQVVGKVALGVPFVGRSDREHSNEGQQQHEEDHRSTISVRPRSVQDTVRHTTSSVTRGIGSEVMCDVTTPAPGAGSV